MGLSPLGVAIHDIDDDQQCLPCWALLGHMQYAQSVAADAVDDAQALEDQAIHSYEVMGSVIGLSGGWRITITGQRLGVHIVGPTV